MVMDSKEDNNGTEGNTSSNTTGENIVVLLPPGSVLLSDIVHESNTHIQAWSAVRQVVRGISHETKGEENWVEVLTNDSSAKVPLKSPTWEHQKETNQETPLENRVETTKHLLWTNDTPEDGSRVESGGSWTGESLWL